MDIAPDVTDLIDRKATVENPQAAEGLSDVINAIEQLNDHISRDRRLSEAEIEKFLDFLVGSFTLTLDLPIKAGLKILRAVKYDVRGAGCGHDRVCRLSYFKTCDEKKPAMGRLNKQGDAVYYGSIYFNETWGGVNVAFAEVNVKTGDRINILDSITTDEIKVRYIGIYDFVRRNRKPDFLHDETFDYFRKIYAYQKKKFDVKLFAAYQLCDAFFADIMRRKESGRLYEVTSVLGAMFLENKSTDGLIYTSVKAEGSPVIALKPDCVDAKVNHLKARSFRIQKDCGYAMFFAEHNCDGVIGKEGSIVWSKRKSKKTAV